MPFKRKTYGKAKPVKKAKILPPKKPSTLILKSLYRSVSRSSHGQHLERLSEILFWWQDAIKYVKSKRPIDSVEHARNLLAAYDWQKKGQQAEANAEKERCFVEAVGYFRKYVSGMVDVPALAPFVKAYKENNKQAQQKAKQLAPRFDPFLTLLMSCFRSCSFTFQVVPDIAGDRTPARKVLHDVSKILYTRALAMKLMKKTRQEGLLPVIIDEARHISRAMAYIGMADGKFLTDQSKQFQIYMQLMADFVDFAANTSKYPKLVKSKLSKPKKDPSTKKMPRIKVPYVKIPRDKGIMSQLVDEMMAETLAKS